MIRVLVVDDDKDLLEMVSLMLSFSGFSVSQLDTGNALMPTIGDQPPDVVLMDIFLGDCDGRDLCRTLKNNPGASHVKVMLYSAGTIDPENARQSGADDFIAKPFEMGELIARVKALTNTIG